MQIRELLMQHQSESRKKMHGITVPLTHKCCLFFEKNLSVNHIELIKQMKNY